MSYTEGQIVTRDNCGELDIAPKRLREGPPVFSFDYPTSDWVALVCFHDVEDIKLPYASMGGRPEAMQKRLDAVTEAQQWLSDAGQVVAKSFIKRYKLWLEQEAQS